MIAEVDRTAVASTEDVKSAIADVATKRAAAIAEESEAAAVAIRDMNQIAKVDVIVTTKHAPVVRKPNVLGRTSRGAIAWRMNSRSIASIRNAPMRSTRRIARKGKCANSNRANSNEAAATKGRSVRDAGDDVVAEVAIEDAVTGDTMTAGARSTSAAPMSENRARTAIVRRKISAMPAAWTPKNVRTAMFSHPVALPKMLKMRRIAVENPAVTGNASAMTTTGDVRVAVDVDAAAAGVPVRPIVKERRRPTPETGRYAAKANPTSSTPKIRTNLRDVRVSRKRPTTRSTSNRNTTAAKNSTTRTKASRRGRKPSA